jgi:hypothetical protein
MDKVQKPSNSEFIHHRQNAWEYKNNTVPLSLIKHYVLNFDVYGYKIEDIEGKFTYVKA